MPIEFTPSTYLGPRHESGPGLTAHARDKLNCRRLTLVSSARVIQQLSALQQS